MVQWGMRLPRLPRVLDVPDLAGPAERAAAAIAGGLFLVTLGLLILAAVILSKDGR